MHTGMLWFDNSKRSTKEKIQEAVNYYVKKYGIMPDLCWMNPKSLDKDIPQIDGLSIRPYRPVLPGHIWIGIEDKG